jgi:hypothetical protein
MKWTLLLAAATLLFVHPGHGLAQQAADSAPDQAAIDQRINNPPAPAPAPSPAAGAAANDIADFFSKVGDQIYEDCIFELSEEQVEVQSALVQAYVEQGASNAVARRLAVKQIQPPPLSAKCEEIRRQPQAPTADWETTLSPAKNPPVEAAAKPVPAPAPAKAPVTAKAPEKPAPIVALANKKVLPHWDCAEGVDYVTIKLNGFQRKLTGGEICNPYEDVVREVPETVRSFRLGYTVATGRLFVVSDDPQASGKTIAWAISGRDVCRNNPDPDCFAARAVGPLPPGEYSFSAEKERRINWGPKTKRNVAGIYLRKLWNKDRFTPQQTAAILARGNIAIHVRLKGEMSEACIGLEPKGWAYVASLIKDGRATGVNVYIDEPHPQIAEAPPVVVASTFSLTSLFK